MGFLGRIEMSATQGPYVVTLSRGNVTPLDRPGCGWVAIPNASPNASRQGEHVGAVLTDLGSRRAQIQGTDAEDDEGLRTRVSALVPQLELVDYPIALRSVARGTGELHRSPHGYQPMPERLAAEHAAG